jgi:hypothetical protein
MFTVMSISFDQALAARFEQALAGSAHAFDIAPANNCRCRHGERKACKTV